MKKFDCCLWIFLAFLSVPSFSQDSLVHFRDLQFYSEFERNAFLKQGNRYDFFSLFMANGGLLDDSKIVANREQFFNFVSSLEYEKSQGKKNDKRMKPVYEAMHKRFLVKYEERNKFEEIFYNGYYNCVSASALYAIAFEKMNVPYIIKEEPNHVYLIVYPGEQQLTLQTTSPTGISKPVSTDLKERFVAMLQAQKLVTSKEVNGNVNGVFERYYFRGKADINLTQLAGIQYFNDGLTYFEEKDYEHAVKQFQKAYYLYPSQQIGYTLMMACYASFSNHETRDSLQAMKLARMSRFKRMGLTNRSFVGEFAIVTHDMLGQADSRDKYDGYY